MQLKIVQRVFSIRFHQVHLLRRNHRHDLFTLRDIKQQLKLGLKGKQAALVHWLVYWPISFYGTNHRRGLITGTMLSHFSSEKSTITKRLWVNRLSVFIFFFVAVSHSFVEAMSGMNLRNYTPVSNSWIGRWNYYNAIILWLNLIFFSWGYWSI